MTMKSGRRSAALAVVAETNAESTTLRTMNTMKTAEAVWPKRRISHRAIRLASPVATSMLARTNDMMFSHITGWPSSA